MARLGRTMPQRPITRMRRFRPFNVTTNQTNAKIPTDCSGAWITLVGAGGSGGPGGTGLPTTNGWYCAGGGGGGGGGRFPRQFVPRGLMGGLTYSTAKGLGVAGSDGPDTTFTAGGLVITAGGGKVGPNGPGPNSSSLASGGTPGGWSVTGATGFTAYNGSPGGSTANSGQPSADAGAGGGGGGYIQNQSGTNADGGGGGGGASNPAGGTVNGGAAGVIGGTGGSPGNQDPQLAGGPGAGGGGGNKAGGGGTGGAGGNYGGGGGGGGPGSSLGRAGGTGGDGYFLIEWV